MSETPAPGIDPELMTSAQRRIWQATQPALPPDPEPVDLAAEVDQLRARIDTLEQMVSPDTTNGV